MTDSCIDLQQPSTFEMYEPMKAQDDPPADKQSIKILEHRSLLCVFASSAVTCKQELGRFPNEIAPFTTANVFHKG